MSDSECDELIMNDFSKEIKNTCHTEILRDKKKELSFQWHINHFMLQRMNVGVTYSSNIVTHKKTNTLWFLQIKIKENGNAYAAIATPVPLPSKIKPMIWLFCSQQTPIDSIPRPWLILKPLNRGQSLTFHCHIDFFNCYRKSFVKLKYFLKK